MNKINFKTKLARLILYLNLSLIVIVVVFFSIGAFDFEEFSAIVSVLSAVTAVYFGALFQFLGSDLEKDLVNEEDDLSDDKSNLIRSLIVIHFMAIISLIFMKALTIINFQNLILLIGFIETSFGAFLGKFISFLFDNEKK